MRTIANRAIRVGKVTALAIGVGVMLAVVFGVGTTALAALPGDPFKLGQVNVINGAVTSLVGVRAGGAMMLVDNNSSAVGSRALDLRTEAGRAPLTVNPEAGKAPNFDADRVDGREAASFANGTGGKANDADKLDGKDSAAFFSARARCDAEDPVLGGGISIGGSLDNQLVRSDPQLSQSPTIGDEWIAVIQDNGGPSAISATAICADFPPLR